MSDELKQELLQFLKTNDIAQLATVQDNKPWLRVMSTARIDENLTLWFATFEDCNKVKQIESNGEVCVLYHADGADAVIAGTADVLRDPESKAYAWNERYAQFFPKGSADPGYVVLKITPTQAYLRDFKKYGNAMQQVI